MKRVTACHGVGRKPEDGKRLHIIELRLLSPVSRVPYFLLPNEGLTPLTMDMSPTGVGYKFRSPTARKLIAIFQFVGLIGVSSKMLLMFLLLTKSLGHVWKLGRKRKFVLTLREEIYILTLALPGPVAGRV